MTWTSDQRLQKLSLVLRCQRIDLVTVFDAILTSRQTREKLQCFYKNLMSNNFRKTTVLKKYEFSTKASLLRILPKKIEGVIWVRRPRTTFLKFSIHLSVRKSRENYTQIYGKSKENLWRSLSAGTPPKFLSTVLSFVALVYNWYFFQNSRFTEIIRH